MRGRAMTGSLADFMRQMEGDGENKPRPMHAAQIMSMQEYLRVYRSMVDKGCPYKVGDLVTPVQNRSVRDPGEPVMVVDTRPLVEVRPAFAGGDVEGTAANGRWNDMRVARIDSDGDIATFWVESADFEPYDPEVHGKGK